MPFFYPIIGHLETAGCQKCGASYQPKVKCGACGAVTLVPATVFSNKLRAAKLDAKKGYDNTKQGVLFSLCVFPFICNLF